MRKDAPFLSLSMGLAAGIVARQYIVVEDLLWLRIAAAIGALLLAVVHFNWIRWSQRYLSTLYVITTHLLIAYAGYEYSALSDRTKKAEGFQTGHPVSMIIRLSEPPKKTENGYRLKANILAIKDSSVWRDIGLGAQIYTSKQEVLKDVERGDELICSGRIEMPDTALLPGTFNNRRYLWSQNIYYSFYADEMLPYRKSENFDLLAIAQRVQKKLAKWIDKKSKNEINAGILKALVLGERTGIDRELSDKFSKIGVIHVLAVSGLHVGIMYLVFGFLFSPIRKLPAGTIIHTFSVLLALWGYAFLTGLAPSVSRSALMFSIVLIGEAIGRRHFTYNTLACSAFILMLGSPHVIYQLGFQLSYAAVLGIVAIAVPLQKRLRSGDWLLDKIIALMLVSLAAQLGTLPLSLYYFGQFPNLFLISNLFVIPLITIVLYGTLTAIVCGLAGWEVGASYLMAYSETNLFAIRRAADVLLQSRFAWTEGLYLHLWDVVCLYLVIFAIYKIISRRSIKSALPLLAIVLLWVIPYNHRSGERFITKVYAVQGKGNQTIHLWTKGQTAFCLLPQEDYANSSYYTNLIEQHAERYGYSLEWIPFELAFQHRYLNKHGFYSTGKGLLQVFGQHFQINHSPNNHYTLVSLDEQ